MNYLIIIVLKIIKQIKLKTYSSCNINMSGNNIIKPRSIKENINVDYVITDSFRIYSGLNIVDENPNIFCLNTNYIERDKDGKDIILNFNAFKNIHKLFKRHDNRFICRKDGLLYISVLIEYEWLMNTTSIPYRTIFKILNNGTEIKRQLIGINGNLVIDCNFIIDVKIDDSIQFSIERYVNEKIRIKKYSMIRFQHYVVY